MASGLFFGVAGCLMSFSSVFVVLFRMSDVIFTHFRGVVAVWLVEKTVSEGPFY